MSSATNDLPRPLVDDIVRAALLEDLGRAGDVTSQACLPPDAKADAVIRSRQPGTIAGLPLAASAFRQIGDGITFTTDLSDGARIEPGDDVARIQGPALLVLSAERVALNFLTHLSGIATATRSFADAIAHTPAKVACTRKTLPGLRAVQKYAVRKGGGSNHRFGLDDAILIKDNHIAICGGVVEAVHAAKAFAGHLMAIEIEVDTLDQFALILALPDAERPDVVMLDNMDPQRLAKGVAMNREAGGKPVILEASGGIALNTIASVAESGVDYISSGWLTSSAPSLDLGLDIDIK
jgi:nicotinate-nucleotide pyrophosphorylase (carboxylating)